MQDYTERRKHPRTPLDLEIEVSRLQSEDAVEPFHISRCRCRDISGGGISFFSQDVYASQSILRLHIPLDNLNIKVMGKVMWSKQMGEPATSVTGVQFLNIYEQDFETLCAYIMTRCL